MRTDVLVLSKNPAVQLERLLQTVQVGQVVADGSNSAGFCARWRRECQSAGIPFHSVVDNGPFILDLQN